MTNCPEPPLKKPNLGEIIIILGGGALLSELLILDRDWGGYEPTLGITALATCGLYLLAREYKNRQI